MKAALPEKEILKIGFDLGTNVSVVVVGGNTPPLIVPTVVGYAEGILDGILPKTVVTLEDGRQALFGDEALAYRRYLKLYWPVAHGLVVHEQPCRHFIGYIRKLIDPEGNKEIRAVTGIPATDHAKMLNKAVFSVMEKIIQLPEPFLAAMGYRDESKLSGTAAQAYVDPCRHSLFIDIGAGTTDFAVVKGYYPDKDEQFSINFAGNDIDGILAMAISRKYPTSNVPRTTITRIKETHSFVGQPPGNEKVIEKLVIRGKEQTLELTEEVKKACEAIIPILMPNVIRLIEAQNSEDAEAVMSNIVITGGGNLIRNLGPTLERMLHDEGYKKARVRCVGKGYKVLVAEGAYKVARAARDDQWQIPL